VTSLRASNLPVLPLLLWDTPPGLELALAQDGVCYRVIRSSHPLAFRAGRFVLYDSRSVTPTQLRAQLAPEHVAIDVDQFRRGEAVDPFRALIDSRAHAACWDIDGLSLTERVARYAKAGIRERLVEGVREAVVGAGGLWARLGAFPFPFRSAFNFRADLDERYVEDYARFARARRPLADCVTHFVCTQAYGDVPAVLQDLLRVDTQSHGHYHVVYRDPDANLRNLRRADALLRESGFEPTGYAAPHGRWNPGLDDVIEALGYVYSSDFQLGYDDLPFFPWRADAGRFSRVLQVPIHPICEGLFFEAGATGGKVIADHLLRVVRAKIAAGAPAFVYGHPERRLAHHPDVLATLAEEVANESLVWRVTLTEFAHWWRWRASRAWSVLARGEGRFEIQFDDWGNEFPLTLELVRENHRATIPLTRPVTPLQLDELAYERRETPAELPAAFTVSRPPSLRSVVRHAIDWETITPLDELPAHTLAARMKKGLRWWRQSRREEARR
jgi:peptidoglycan/xylan/chitin deacetylase (PgdA/CDA1 family)